MKCRSGNCADGDTWCRLCSSAQALSDSGRYKFQSRAHRSLAEELAVQVVRQVDCLITLDKQVQSQTSSLSDRLRNCQSKLSELTDQLDKTAGAKSKPGKRIAEPQVAAPVKVEKEVEEEADFGSESKFEEESEEEGSGETEPAGGRASGSGVARTDVRPRSPSQPPRRVAKEAERKVSRSRDRGRRAGRKHQGHHRGLKEPERVFHRTPRFAPIAVDGKPKQTFYSRK